MTYCVHNGFALSAGYALYDKRNFPGERLIPSLEQGERYHDLSFRASLVY